MRTVFSDGTPSSWARHQFEWTRLESEAEHNGSLVGTSSDDGRVLCVVAVCLKLNGRSACTMRHNVECVLAPLSACLATLRRGIRVACATHFHGAEEGVMFARKVGGMCGILERPRKVVPKSDVFFFVVKEHEMLRLVSRP